MMLQVIIDTAVFVADYWVILMLAALASCYYYGTYTFSALKSIGIDGPKPVPFLGNFLEMQEKKLFNFLHEYTQKYGKIWACFNGRRPNIVIAKPDMLRQILVKYFSKFVNRDVLRINDRKGLVVAQDEDWKRIRSTLTPTFSAAKIKMMVPLIHNSSERLVHKFEEAANSKKSVEVWSMYGKFTMEVILSAALGVEANTQNDPNDEYTALAAKVLQANIIAGLIGYCFPLLLPLYAFLFPSKSLNGLKKLATNIIHARKTHNFSKHHDLLQLMLKAQKDSASDESKGLSDNEVIAQAITFLVAGYDTTSNTLTYVSYLLALNPDIQERLLAEIDENFPNEQVPDYDTVQNVPYLDMVVNEALRLFPPGFRIDRVCKEACNVDGVEIPEGVTVLIPIYSIHRDPEYWPNPEKFDPERFTPEAKAGQHPYAFLPFGAGPRSCIGLRFALIEAKLALVMVLKRFKFERALDTQEPLKLKGIITMSPADGAYLKIIPRK